MEENIEDEEMINKKKIILFGATDFVYRDAMKTINFNMAEVVAFADNDKNKWGVELEGIKIIAPHEISRQSFDYILIGALYSYSSIKQQVVQLGIDKNKVMPLFEYDNLKWLKDSAADIDIEAVMSIFLNGEAILNKLEEVSSIISQYTDMEAINKTVKIVDYEKYPLIAHACGGYVRGKKEEYTNSLEAFKEAMDNGFKMFECDVWGVENEKIILGSRLKMQYPIKITFTIPSLDDLLELIKDDIEKKLILDIKYNTKDDYYRMLDAIEELAKTYERRGYLNIREQLLIETFDEETTRYAVEHKWECLLTDYRNKEGDWLMKSAVICSKYGVQTLMVGANRTLNRRKYLELVAKKNFNIISYTVDKIDDYAALRNMGIIACLTNFLKPVS